MKLVYGGPGGDGRKRLWNTVLSCSPILIINVNDEETVSLLLAFMKVIDSGILTPTLIKSLNTLS